MKKLSFFLSFVFMISFLFAQSNNPSFQKLLTAANNGNPKAQAKLGTLYYKGEGGLERNHKTAGAWFLKAAKQGNASAQYHLGILYEAGQEYIKAVYWYDKAAAQKHPNSVDKLGSLYTSGQVASDVKGRTWLTKEATNGDAIAQHLLGGLFYNAVGVAKDYKKAFSWYSKAANQNLPIAQYNLGVAYDFGNGVTQNTQKAIEWYTKSAEQGYDLAQINLSQSYYDKGDYKKSFHYLRLAAEQGATVAYYNLGAAYVNGKGTSVNYKQAYYWFQKSADSGNEKASSMMELLTSKGLV